MEKIENNSQRKGEKVPIVVKEKITVEVYLNKFGVSCSFRIDGLNIPVLAWPFNKKDVFKFDFDKQVFMEALRERPDEDMLKNMYGVSNSNGVSVLEQISGSCGATWSLNGNGIFTVGHCSGGLVVRGIVFEDHCLMMNLGAER